MRKLLHIVNNFYIIGVFIAVCSITNFSVSAQTTPVANTSALEEVFLKIKAPLDEPRGLCVDIPGHKARVNVKRPLSVHTCKWTIWNLDERFDLAAFAQGNLRLPHYNLCAGVDLNKDKESIVLGECDGSPERRWNFVDGRLILVAIPNFCLTVGKEASELTPGGRRLPSRNVARSLALKECSNAAQDRQNWHLVGIQK
jgi:hypothetical protein